MDISLDRHRQAPRTYPGSQVNELSRFFLGRLEYGRSTRTCIAVSYRGCYFCSMVRCKLEDKLGELKDRKVPEEAAVWGKHQREGAGKLV